MDEECPKCGHSRGCCHYPDNLLYRADLLRDEQQEQLLDEVPE